MQGCRRKCTVLSLFLLLWLGGSSEGDCQPSGGATADTSADGSDCASPNCPETEQPITANSEKILRICVRSQAKPFIFPRNSTYADELLKNGNVAELDLREFAAHFQGFEVDLILAIAT